MRRQTSLLILALAICGSALLAVIAILLSVEQAREFRNAQTIARSVERTRAKLRRAPMPEPAVRQDPVPSAREAAQEAKRADETRRLEDQLTRLRSEVSALRRMLETLAEKPPEAPPPPATSQPPSLLEETAIATTDASTSTERSPLSTAALSVPPPSLPHDTARVEAVTQTRGVCVLAAGKRDGLVVHQLLTLHRGDRPIGQARVLTVQDGLAGAEVLSGASGVELRPGDEARWQLPPLPPVTPTAPAPEEIAAPPDRAAPL